MSNALKVEVSRKADGSLKLSLLGEMPALEAGERLVLTLSPSLELSPAGEAQQALDDANAEKDAAKAEKNAKRSKSK